MTSEELYSTYASWTGLLHFWVVKHLNAQVNFEFYPAPEWKIAIYAGIPTPSLEGTVPAFECPADAIKLKLPEPANEPTGADLEKAFRACCEAAARVLGVRLDKAALPAAKRARIASCAAAKSPHR